MACLVDSSVWIAASRSDNKECLQLKRLILGGEALYITRLIQVEVCQGAKTEELFHTLWASLLGFPALELTDALCGHSAYNYYRCRKKGLTLSTIDCLIATMAGHNKIPLWTLDKTLRKAAPLIGCELFTP